MPGFHSLIVTPLLPSRAHAPARTVAISGLGGGHRPRACTGPHGIEQCTTGRSVASWRHGAPRLAPPLVSPVGLCCPPSRGSAARTSPAQSSRAALVCPLQTRPKTGRAPDMRLAHSTRRGIRHLARVNPPPNSRRRDPASLQRVVPQSGRVCSSACAPFTAGVRLSTTLARYRSSRVLQLQSRSPRCLVLKSSVQVLEGI